jgi:uncharacterized iron-regulated protein
VASDVCPRPGDWVEPDSGAVVGLPDVVARAAGHRIVLLGERHDWPDHHRWQLHVLAALAATGRPLVLGFEAFPRAVQPVLDAWSRGEIETSALLERTDWARVWGGEPDLYLPLLHFARMHRVPIVALNVPRSLVRAVSRGGWASVPAAKRLGLTAPAPADPAQRARLADAYESHRCAPAPPEALDRFVEAQLVWDRAMASALAAATRAYPDALVVGIVGEGHAERPGGIAHQLASVNAPAPLVLLPRDVTPPCPPVPAGVADLVFGVLPLPSERPPPHPSPCQGPASTQPSADAEPPR